jgi:xylose isomerase
MPATATATSDPYAPRPEHRFTFGLWTVGNPGADPFGVAVRPRLAPTEIVAMLGRVGAYGVNLHDEDLIPIDASPSEAKAIVQDFRRALADHGVVVPMATTNLFRDPAFKDGAFTANDARVRAFAVQKTMRAIDLGVELGAKVYVLWGGREGVETDACRNPLDALKRYRECLDYLCAYVESQGYDLRFALEAKPNEPRSDIYLPTTGAILGFIATLARPQMVGVNPEVAHEHMAGLNFTHALAQAYDAGKLFHVDLNDQNFARYDQDLRFGSQNPKAAFFLVKFLEDVKWDGCRHFDAHAYRTEDVEGVADFARGCMRSYLILKAKAQAFAADREIQDILADLRSDPDGDAATLTRFDPAGAATLKGRTFDRQALGRRGLRYERLDQLTMELLWGVR